MHIEHLVVPVAGLGTRLQPLTLRRPKALIKVHGIPMIQYVLEETRGTSIRHVVAVINPGQAGEFKRYFKSVQKKFPHLTFHIRFQKHLLGDGHAVLQAADIVKNHPYAVRFTDDILVYKKPLFRSLLSAYEKVGNSVVLLKKVPRKDVSRYGVVAVRDKKAFQGGTLYAVTDVIEKPPVEKAPSNLIILGGYVIDPAVMKTIKQLAKPLRHHQKDGLRLTDAFKNRLVKGGKIHGWQFPGVRLDCGTLAGLKEAEKFLS